MVTSVSPTVIPFNPVPVIAMSSPQPIHPDRAGFYLTGLSNHLLVTGVANGVRITKKEGTGLADFYRADVGPNIFRKEYTLLQCIADNARARRKPPKSCHVNPVEDFKSAVGRFLSGGKAGYRDSAKLFYHAAMLFLGGNLYDATAMSLELATYTSQLLRGSDDSNDLTGSYPDFAAVSAAWRLSMTVYGNTTRSLHDKIGFGVRLSQALHYAHAILDDTTIDAAYVMLHSAAFYNGRIKPKEVADHKELLLEKLQSTTFAKI